LNAVRGGRARDAVGRTVRAGGVALVAALVAVVAGPCAAGAAAASGDWTRYHGDPAGAGVASGLAAVGTATRAWTSRSLDGTIFGQPVASSGLVFVATENDTVVALRAATGTVVWSRHLGTPVPASALACGDITPTVGITGTPVIDPVRREVFVVADELRDGQPAHVLVGLSTATGAIAMTQAVDPAGADPTALLQRTGLALDAGRVIFGLGGNFGDCGSYRGRVVSVAETGGTPAFFTVDAAANQSQGAIWMGGAAPVVDPHGTVWVSAGNGSVTSAAEGYDNSDSALALTPLMRLVAAFAPTSWPQDNALDRDMATAPALLANGQVVVAGKSGIAYLLDGSHPGGVGGQEASLAGACPDEIVGGTAVRGSTVVLPCLSGPVAVRVSATPARLTLLWRASVGGGPPIVAAGLVWTIGQDGVLYGLDPASGAVRAHAPIGALANHFPTPGIGEGLLLVPNARQIVAFRTTAAAPAAGAAATPPPSPAATRRAGGSQAPPDWVWVPVAGAVIAIGAGAALIWRRRR